MRYDACSTHARHAEPLHAHEEPGEHSITRSARCAKVTTLRSYSAITCAICPSITVGNLRTSGIRQAARRQAQKFRETDAEDDGSSRPRSVCLTLSPGRPPAEPASLPARTSKARAWQVPGSRRGRSAQRRRCQALREGSTRTSPPSMPTKKSDQTKVLGSGIGRSLREEDTVRVRRGMMETWRSVTNSTRIQWHRRSRRWACGDAVCAT